MIKFVFLFFLLGISRTVLSAPCCAGNAQFPTIIAGDDRQQITSTLSFAGIPAEASVDGSLKYRKKDDLETSRTLRLDFASLISDRFQVGFSLPWVHRHRERKTKEYSASGLGDLTSTVSYEILPEWSYSFWKPRGFLFLNMTAPSGGSVWDTTEMFKLDSRGRGFWTLGLGTLLLKAIGNWDFSFLMEGHQGFSRTLTQPLGELTLNPGWGFTSQVGVGFSPQGGDLRIGTSLSRSFEKGTETQGVFSGQGADMALWTPSFQLSYLLSEDMALNLSYANQALLLGSQNSALQETFGFVFQKRWSR